MNYPELKQIDFKHLWHPFTQASVWIQDEPLIIARAKGVELFDVQDRAYLDGVSSLWCNVHGHGVSELVDAIKHQSEMLCHSTLLGISHEPVLLLCKDILEVVPKNLKRFFFSDSGSAAVEAALRMAVEWWQKKENPKPKKAKFISLSEAYHGDTLGAVSVGYNEVFHAAVNPLIKKSLTFKSPEELRLHGGLKKEEAERASLLELQMLLEKHNEEVAAVIIEPLVQGAAGIWIQSSQFVQGVQALCRTYDVLFICDEVATGFGKTGEMFAVTKCSVEPDIMILAKGLTAGYLPMSVVLTTEEIFQGFVGRQEEFKTFFFGQTFAGNPVGAAVAKANLTLFKSSKLLEKLPKKIEYFKRLLDELIAPLEHVFEIRSCGMMVGIEFTKEPGKFVPYSSAELAGVRVVREARKRGVIIRPLGNVMILMPPLVMPEAELERLVSVTRESIVSALCPK